VEPPEVRRDVRRVGALVRRRREAALVLGLQILQRRAELRRLVVQRELEHALGELGDIHHGCPIENRKHSCTLSV